MLSNIKIIGIAGGSGSGKSTLAVSLYKKYPDKYSLLQIDDYFKNKEDAPIYKGFVNWDDPKAIKFGQLYRDIIDLRNGKPVKILTKSELYNPGFNHKLRNKIKYTVKPKSILIVEGYLALYDERVRDLMDLKIYLDISISKSTKRRTGNKFKLDDEYIKQVLQPMYVQFVKPTKVFADLVVDVSNKNEKEVFDLIEKIL